MQEREIKKFRTLNSKHIIQEDKTIQVQIYNENVHYLENGEYKDIDNTIIEEKDRLKNKFNDFKVAFNKNDGSIDISKNNKVINMSLESANMKTYELSKDKKLKNIDKVKFNNVFNNIDVIYEIHPNKLKEKIVLNNKVNMDEIKFIFKTDLKLELTKDNSIIVKDNDKVIYVIEKSFMVDANNELSENIKYVLNQKDNNYELTIQLDKEWLDSKTRKYPVIIDPTVDHYEDVNNVINTYIYNGDSNTTTYNKGYLLVGVDNQYTYRSLLNFKLPEIPASYKLVEAHLRLGVFVLSPSDFDDRSVIAVHKLIEDWTEEKAKWSNMSNEYSSEIEDYFNFPKYSSKATPTIDIGKFANITRLVKDWYNNPETNYGLMLKLYDEEAFKNTKTFAMFASNDTEYIGDNPKPVVEIRFKNYNGVESYLSYSSQGHFFGTSYVSNYTGNLTSTFEVANTVGGPLPSNLYLAYNTYDIALNNDYGYGLGVKPSLMQFVEKTTYEDNPLAYTDEDGGIHYFYKKVLDYSGNDIIYSEEYYDEDGLGLELKLEETNYIMTDKNQNQYKFVDNGSGRFYLRLITDTNGKTITIDYDTNNRITKVVDATNHEITVSYSTNKIVFTSPYKTTEVNLTNNLITSITSLGSTETITYNSDKQIEKIISPSGITLKYDYQNDIVNKVSKVTEIGSDGEEGNYLTFSYQLTDTKVTDRKGDINTYIFNDYGNVVGVTSLDDTQKLKNAYGKTYTFGSPEENNVNKMLTDKSLIKYVNNLIEDSSFENNNIIFTSSDSSIVSTICDDTRSGLNSLKVVSNNVNSYIYKNMVVEKGIDYTFSLYVKNEVPLNVSLSYDNKKETVSISEINNEYTRYQVSINYETSATSDLKIEIQPTKNGQVIIDDVQLEVGKVANYYNLVTNSDLSNGLEDWEVDASSREDDYVEVVSIAEGENALRMHMAPLGYVSTSRKFNIKGKKGDTFNLSFWYKNNSIEPSAYNGLIPGLWATIFFGYVNSDEIGACVPARTLNVGNDNWQFFSENFVTEEDYDYLVLRVNSFGGANDCYLTNFSLFKDLEQYSYDYDENGNLISSTDLAKETSTMKYNKDNQLLQTMSPMGNKFTFEYDNKVTDRMLRAISPTGVTNEVVYDENCNPIRNKINNRKILDEIDNNKTYYVRAKGTDKYFNVNPDKTLRVKENECSYDKFYIIKNDKEQIKFKHAVLNNYYLKVVDNSIKLMYGDYDNIFYLKSNDNSSYSIVTSNVVYDPDETENYINKAFTINEDYSITISDWVSFDYNQEFFFEQTENKLFIESNATYTDDGRFISSVTDSLGNTSIYDYNTTNGLLNSVTDPDNNSTYYTYDSKLRLTNIKKGEEQVSYEYNGKNLLSNIVFGTDNYKFIYDQYNNPLSTKINDNTLITNTYEANNGNLLKVTYGNNDEIHYTYDKLNRLESIIKENDTYTNYYDNLGRIAKLSSNTTNYLYEYDFAKRLSTYKYDNYSTNYDYDKDNLVDKKEEKLANTMYTYNYEYNTESALTKLTNNNSEFNYNYDVLGRLDNQNINGKYVTSYKYITSGNKTSTVIEEVNDNGVIYNYTYDKLGNITEVYKDKVLIHKYYYDMYSELIKEDDLENDLTKQYVYDNYGNILSKKTYTYNTTNLVEEDKYTYGNSKWQDLLTKFNNETITYDEIGNPLTIGNKTLTWMNGRELSTYSDGTNNISYKYNVDGIRTSKKVNDIETNYILEGTSIIFEDRNGDVIYYIYNGSELLGFVYKNKTYYYHKNVFGDIIGILDDNYNEIVTYEYDSWGALVNVTDNSNINLGTINPFRYRSYYYDEETQLYYLNSRYYNPEWGRFINADGYVSTGQGINSANMFMYCGNNFIVAIDESGNFTKFLKFFQDTLSEITKRIRQMSMDVGAAPDYKSYSAHPFTSQSKADEKYLNCYSYVVGRPVNDKMSAAYPGSYCEVYKPLFVFRDINVADQMVRRDFESLGRTIREIDGPEAEISSNEYRIAMRVTETPIISILTDVHFMVQTSSGFWAEKNGSKGGTKLWDNGKNPDEINWNKGLYNYNSRIIYYAVSN